MMRRAEVAQCDVRLTLELLSEGERDVRLADTRLWHDGLGINPFGKRGLCNTCWPAGDLKSAHGLPNSNFWADIYDAKLFKYLTFLARPKRFELLTPRFVVRCSYPWASIHGIQ